MASLKTSALNAYPTGQLIPNTITLAILGYLYKDIEVSRDLKPVQPVRYATRYQDLLTEVTVAWPSGSSRVDFLTYEAIKPRIFVIEGVEGSKVYLRELTVKQEHASDERFRWSVIATKN